MLPSQTRGIGVKPISDLKSWERDGRRNRLPLSAIALPVHNQESQLQKATYTLRL
jgi:hypothetical protein